MLRQNLFLYKYYIDIFIIIDIFIKHFWNYLKTI